MSTKHSSEKNNIPNYLSWGAIKFIASPSSRFIRNVIVAILVTILCLILISLKTKVRLDVAAKGSVEDGDSGTVAFKLPIKNLPQIHEGQLVRIRFEAFESDQRRLAEATIVSVELPTTFKTARETDSSLEEVFIARAQLSDPKMFDHQPFIPGMRLSGSILVGQVTVFDLLISKLTAN